MGVHGSKQLLADLEKLRKNDPTVVSLNYEHSQLGDEGAKVLANALSSNYVLKRLRLGDCNLTAFGLQAICRSLCEDRIVPGNIRKLELCTSRPAVGILTQSQPCGNPLGDNGAKCLAYLVENSASLHHLTVAACQLGDEGAVALAKALQRNSSLKTLDLSYNSISDIGVEEIGNALKTNTTLRGLSLWHNRLFHSGAEALANGLTSNSSLQWLGLGCNHIGDEGAKAIAIALLSNATNSGLVWLALGGNEITDRGVEHLAVALMAQRSSNGQQTVEQDDTSSQASLTEQIRTGGLRPMLELGVTPSHVSIAVSEEGEQQTSNQNSDTYCIPLESLGLGGNQMSCAGATMLADGLKSNTRLSSLGLADNRISDEGAMSLADLIRHTDTLQKLVLSGNNIHDEGGSTLIAALSQNTSLDSLYLAGNPLGDSVGVRCEEVIGRHNHSLQVLDLHNTRMTTPALTNLVEVLRNEGVLKCLGCRDLPTAPPSQDKLQFNQLSNTGPYRAGRKYVSATVVPSQRHTTLEALGSLPLPDESAQAMVVKESSRLTKRRESISQYIRRKLSKSAGSRRGNTKDDPSPSHSAGRRRSRHTPPPIELVPLVEEHQHDLSTLDGTDVAETSVLNGGPFSDWHLPSSQTGVKRIDGITRTEPVTPINSPVHSARVEKPLKDQWHTALRMRVGMLRMGGFLHSGYNSVLAADSAGDKPDYQVASLLCNVSKNRPSAPLPPTHTRVKLQLVMEEVGSDYINASYVGSPGHPKSYIVTQSPLVDTIDDLWRLVWEQRVCVIVVLTTEEETQQWWPEEGDTQRHSLVTGKEWAADPLLVSTTSVQVTLSNPDVLVRSISLYSSLDKENQSVTMYHYTAWPNNSVPNSVQDISDLYHNMLSSRLQQAVGSPVLVVSQFGGGRSGCFCAVGIAHELLISPDPNPTVWDQDPNILDQVIRGVRLCRPGLIETQQQYEHCHLILEHVINNKNSALAGETEKKGKSNKWNIFRRK